MMVATHVLTANGHFRDELKPWQGTVEDELMRRLSILDGTQRFSLTLWRLPDGVPLDRVDLDAYPQEYIQAAGSFDGKLTAEVREVVEGTASQYVLGRASSNAEDASGDEVVPWNGHETRVRPHEVLDGSNVSDLFVSYYRTGEVPSSYTRRRLEL
jgi:hypothetical protein